MKISLDVPQNTVGLDITDDETQKLETIAHQATPKKFWDGRFSSSGSS